MSSTTTAARLTVWQRSAKPCRTVTELLPNSIRFGKVLTKLRQQGYTFLGTGRAPWLHNGRDVAVVFEDFRTFDKFWYHVSTWIVEDWKDEVDLYFGKKK